MKELLRKRIKRPAVVGFIGLFIGMIGGYSLLERQAISLFLFNTIFMVFICYKQGYIISTIQKGILIIVVGMSIFLFHPMVLEQTFFTFNQQVSFTGKVVAKQKNLYGEYLTLDEVVISSDQKRRLFTNIQIQLPTSSHLREGNKIAGIGKIANIPKRMNPSDRDIRKQLLGKGICISVKVKEYHIISDHTSLLVQIREKLASRLDIIFQNEDSGLMKALLLGKKNAMDQEVRTLYSTVGIAHVLAISGFHIAFIFAAFLWIFTCFGTPFSIRYIVAGLGVWFYTFLTGSSISTIRAAIMITIMIVARVCWQEEEKWTQLAIAAAIICIYNPFSIYDLGFQFSFIAMIGIYFSEECINKKIGYQSQRKVKRQKLFLAWLFVTLGVTPLIAYYYYEVPGIAIFLNLGIAPIFSFLLFTGWAVLGVSFFSLNIAILLGKLISTLLKIIEYLLRIIVDLPFGTICIGRPNWMHILCFGMILVGVMLWYKEKLTRNKILLGIASSLMVVSIGIGWESHFIEMTSLYVGQGDASVIFTPNNKVLVIDGGKKGKGKVIERYIKSKGKKEIEAIFVSHSHEDHIGGILDLLDSSIKIKQVFISYADDSILLDELKQKCYKKNIPIQAIGAKTNLALEDLSIECIAPIEKNVPDNLNNASLVCFLEYGSFCSLWMGDSEEIVEKEISPFLKKIHLLKVGHHGAKTGTSKTFLQLITPEYSVISCGINNRHHHPHSSVIKRLQYQSSKCLRTDVQGAITFKTDGKRLLIKTFIKGEKDNERTNTTKRIFASRRGYLV